MTVLSLMITAYLVIGLFVILDMYQKQAGDSLIASHWRVDRSVFCKLKMHAMRFMAGGVIAVVWPVFLAAEWSARRRYRMASFIDDEQF